MSEINISYPLDCHIDHSKETLQSLLNALENKYSIKHEFTSEHECKLSGSGVSGQLVLDEEGIEIHAKLGFFMIPFKTVIEAEIMNKLDESFQA